jgi:hypothetical protein
MGLEGRIDRNFIKIVKLINEIDELHSTINKAFAAEMFIIVMHLLFMGISTMFMLAHKITSNVDIFLEDSPIIAYLICLIFLHVKIAQICFISYRAEQKVILVYK